jgi:Zn-finger nucleic acid-binding protein
MDRATFEYADPILDEIGAKLDELLDSDQFAAFRTLLARLGEAVGPRCSVGLTVGVDVFDPQRSNALPLLTVGFSSSNGETPYKTRGDATRQKYVVNGEIEVVPHDHCPKCYGVWDFKFKNLSCSECGATLGREVKLLLDHDLCPFCEEGKVSLTAPVCKKCGQRIDPGVVVWG